MYTQAGPRGAARERWVRVRERTEREKASWSLHGEEGRGRDRSGGEGERGRGRRERGRRRGREAEEEERGKVGERKGRKKSAGAVYMNSLLLLATALIRHSVSSEVTNRDISMYVHVHVYTVLQSQYMLRIVNLLVSTVTYITVRHRDQGIYVI